MNFISRKLAQTDAKIQL